MFRVHNLIAKKGKNASIFEKRAEGLMVLFQVGVISQVRESTMVGRHGKLIPKRSANPAVHLLGAVVKNQDCVASAVAALGQAFLLCGMEQLELKLNNDPSIPKPPRSYATQRLLERMNKS